MASADTALRRYELYGWDYPIHNPPPSDEEVAWYATWAERSPGRLLGLACGTGRLLCRLASEDFEVTGLDLSETMLGLARSNVAALPEPARNRVELVEADMAGFALDRKFGLIFIADNSFRELGTRSDLLRCLRCARKHLEPGGRLLITERRMHPSLRDHKVRTVDWSQPYRCSDTGQLVSRRIEIRLSRDGRRILGNMVYKTIGPDQTETFVECPFACPALTTEQYLELFALAGFRSRAFIGYKEVEDDGKDPILCFVCEHA